MKVDAELCKMIENAISKVLKEYYGDKIISKTHYGLSINNMVPTIQLKIAEEKTGDSIYAYDYNWLTVTTNITKVSNENQ